MSRIVMSGLKGAVSGVINRRDAGGLPGPLAAGGRRRFGCLVLIGFGKAAAAVGTGLLVGVFLSRLDKPIPDRPFHVPGPWPFAVPGPWPVVSGAALLVCALTAAGLRKAEFVVAERLGQEYVHAVRLVLFEHLAAGPSRRAGRGSTGVAVARFVSDMSALRLWAGRGLARIAVAAPLAAGCLVAIAVLHPDVAAAVAVVVAGGLAGTLLQGRALQETTRKARRRRGQLAATVTDRVAHMTVVRAFGRRGAELRRIDRQSRRLRRAVLARSRVIGDIRAVAELTGAVATIAVLLVATVRGISPSAVVMVVTIVGVLVTPLHELARVQEYWQTARVARNKIAEVLARSAPAGVQVAARQRLRRGPGALHLEGVRFDGVLNDVTAAVPPRQVIAVTGRNGAGKSTLLAVAAGLLQPDRGRVLLDGQDLRTIAESDLRTAIGMVGPDLPLLRGTVSENLCYRLPKASLAELYRVRRLTNLDEVLVDLENGISTRIGDGGAGLSSGQRARLALARALLGKPRLLLLDEPDAHLDQSARAVVDRIVAERTCTVLIATHNPDRLHHFDQVWRIDEGRFALGPEEETLTMPSPAVHLTSSELQT